MARLAAFLRTYVAQNQVTGGPLWQKLAVIIDDSGSPGEGEHKIVDYIRNWRRSSDYSPDVVHAICGQDADLIMLGLSLHEPRVIILRDRASPPKKGKGKSGAEHDGKNEKGLDYLRIDRLRQYLLYEFGASLGQPGALPFPFDIEMVLNDFIFLCFLVGNDFLPHLPSLAIREGGEFQARALVEYSNSSFYNLLTVVCCRTRPCFVPLQAHVTFARWVHNQRQWCGLSPLWKDHCAHWARGIQHLPEKGN